MVALQWTPCPSTSLDRFLMYHPEAVARRSKGVNKWLETWGRYMKTESVFVMTGWDENSCIMLSAAFAVCFLSKIPWSAFCLLLSFSLVFLLAVSQGWLGLNFAICVKKKKRCKLVYPLLKPAVTALGEPCGGRRRRRWCEVSQFTGLCALSLRHAGPMQLISLGLRISSS